MSEITTKPVEGTPLTEKQKEHVRAAVLRHVAEMFGPDWGDPFKDFYEALGHEPTTEEWREQEDYVPKLQAVLRAMATLMETGSNAAMNAMPKKPEIGC